jgi:CRISPR-associated protein Cas2
VQKSVFLGDLNSNQMDSLALECEELVDIDTDSVYIFPMDDKC